MNRASTAFAIALVGLFVGLVAWRIFATGGATVAEQPGGSSVSIAEPEVDPTPFTNLEQLPQAGAGQRERPQRQVDFFTTRGNPIAGAEVVLFDGSELLARGTTDARGGVDLAAEAEPARVLLLPVDAPPWIGELGPQSTTVRVPFGSSFDGRVVINGAPPVESFRMTLLSDRAWLDPGSLPASVWGALGPSSFDPRRCQVPVGEQGHFEIWGLTPGFSGNLERHDSHWLVAVLPPVSAPHQELIRVPVPCSKILIELASAPRIRGTLVWKESLEPVSGGRVVAHLGFEWPRYRDHVTPDQLEQRAEGATDAQGRFVIDIPPPAWLDPHFTPLAREFPFPSIASLKAAGPGELELRPVKYEAFENPGIGELGQLELEPLSEIVVFVRDPEDRPIAGAVGLLTVREAPPPPLETDERRQRAHFMREALRSLGYADPTSRLSARAAREVSDEQAWLSEPDGQKRTLLASAQSDLEGGLRFRCAPTGVEHELEVGKFGFQGRSFDFGTEADIEDSAGQPPRVIHLGPAQVVHLIFRDSRDDAQAGVAVRIRQVPDPAKPDFSLEFVPERTDELSGGSRLFDRAGLRYFLSDSAGRISICGTIAKRLRLEVIDRLGLTLEVHEVELGEDREQRIDVRLDQRGTRREGRVEDLWGHPLADARITLMQEMSREERRTDLDGSFVFEELFEHSFSRLQVEREGFVTLSFAPFVFRDDEAPIFRLSPESWFFVRVVDELGQPVPTDDMRLLVPDGQVIGAERRDPSAFSFSSVPNVPVELEARIGFATWKRPLEPLERDQEIVVPEHSPVVFEVRESWSKRALRLMCRVKGAEVTVDFTLDQGNYDRAEGGVFIWMTPGEYEVWLEQDKGDGWERGSPAREFRVRAGSPQRIRL